MWVNLQVGQAIGIHNHITTCILLQQILFSENSITEKKIRTDLYLECKL